MPERRVALHDEFLTQSVREMFQYDERIRPLDLEVRFDGGVAHMTGAVDQSADLLLARSLIGRLAGVFAVWDQVTVGGRPPVVLDVGCGEQKQYPSNVGVDIRAANGVSVVADAAGGLPFADSCVDRVFLVHVLEHLMDFLPLMDDVHRVLRPEGFAHLMSPWWRHVNAVADPTHLRLIDVQTIKGICHGGSDLRWYPSHAGCDGASVFADLQPVGGHVEEPCDMHLARFFD
ncbi:SAM-dependent methyltransferase [Kibdelosporangium banguiense]|uniref:SAM-dependent methyltransferase n=1 Tax=Kibdelosporangium banguiense TaxID=1365924 RepID=A0ABS4U1Y1_9PSEU|nr:methyltransferase domain-containing protein [Kibdelosporangium banguiense]MBP2330674.1 SAM-dependent methyltransferase [Kibdelosporangium banguiense]